MATFKRVGCSKAEKNSSQRTIERYFVKVEQPDIRIRLQTRTRALEIARRRENGANAFKNEETAPHRSKQRRGKAETKETPTIATTLIIDQKGGPTKKNVDFNRIRRFAQRQRTSRAFDRQRKKNSTTN